ncbi:MAG: hypothetical protein HOA95_06575, partial [Planctomycetes bacterium]|nr:hypothetical protein [Planctomycetota bacterium]
GRCRALGLLSAQQVEIAVEQSLEAASQIQTRLLEVVDPQGKLLSAQTEAQDRETWERTFGDGCHLLRGLMIWQSNSARP